MGSLCLAPPLSLKNPKELALTRTTRVEYFDSSEMRYNSLK